ncbi:MAG: hypothetical protein EXQ96_11190 [Alphaproteobacteria bacterium]|nr:hypothetical protein [Alphaproteobacteria bacterium]
MLEFMRKQVSSWFIRIFLVLLIASFALWGIGDIFRGGRETEVATVGAAKINIIDLQTAYRRELARLRPLFGGTLDTEKARELGLVDRTLDGMVARALFDQEVRRLGLVIGDDQVRAEIQRVPQFQTIAGQFDRALFQMAIGQTGFSEETYVAEVRRDSARAQLLEALSGGVEPPRALLDTLFTFYGERRLADLLVLPESLIDAVPDPDATAIEAHYQANRDGFTVPELRAFSYLHLRPLDLVAEVTVSEQQLQAEYDARLADYQQPEKRDLEQILAPTIDVAAKGAELAAVGRALESVAAELRDQGAVHTTLGAVARGDVPENLAGAAFAVTEGGVTEPIRSDFGWHVVRVRKVIPARTRSFAEVREELLRAHQIELAADAIYQLSTKLEDALAGGATLEEVGQKLNLKMQKVAALDGRGRDGEGKGASGLPPVRDLPNLIGRATIGEDSPLTADAENGYVVFRVDAVIPSRLRPLTEVSDQVVVGWRSAERRRGLAKAAEGIMQKLAAGTTLDQVSTEMGIPLTQSPPIGRAAPAGPLVTIELANELYRRAVGEVVSQPARGGTVQVVARLTEVLRADADREPDAFGALRDQVRRLYGSDLTDAYRRHLGTQHKVTVNRTAVDKLF